MRDRPADGCFSWRCHPARERPWRAALGAAIVIALAAVISVELGLWWAGGALVLLSVSLRRFYLPSRFTIDDSAITAQYALRTQRLRWSEVRRFVHDHNGGYLSTRARPSRMDGYRGLHILFGAQRQRVIENIRARIKMACDRSASTGDLRQEEAAREGAARAGHPSTAAEISA